MRLSRVLLLRIIGGITIVVLGIILIVIIVGNERAPVIPVAIQQQLNFVPFVTDNAEIHPASKPYSIDYDKAEKLLVYKLKYNGQVLTISQQATPESFSDVPEVYTQLIVKLRGQTSFNSPAGTVNVTYPVEYKGLQTAVMNSDGVLMFAKPTSNMSTNDWQLLFDQFVTLHS